MTAYIFIQLQINLIISLTSSLIYLEDKEIIGLPTMTSKIV